MKEIVGASICAIVCVLIIMFFLCDYEHSKIRHVYDSDWSDGTFLEYCNPELKSCYCSQKIITQNHKALSDFGLSVNMNNNNISTYEVNMNFRACLNEYVINNFVNNNIFNLSFDKKNNKCILKADDYEYNTIEGYVRYISKEDCSNVQKEFRLLINKCEIPSKKAHSEIAIVFIIILVITIIFVIVIYIYSMCKSYSKRNEYILI